MTNLRWPHEIPISSPERLEEYTPEPLPDRAETVIRLNAESRERIRTAICRVSGETAAEEASEVIRDAGGGLIGGPKEAA